MIFGSEKVITDETKLVEVSKNHYIITIKKSRHVARGNNIEKKDCYRSNKKYFENHPSIKQIQENFQHKSIPSIPYTTT